MKRLSLAQASPVRSSPAEKMLSMADIDLTPVMKMQPNVHNKEFIIDAKKAIVSSQNWSPSGIFQNRDAGLVIESEAIAQYFGKVFDADWATPRPSIRPPPRQCYEHHRGGPHRDDDRAKPCQLDGRDRGVFGKPAMPTGGHRA
jgi:phosphatidylserine/phosphatidylglycerophosphate/cardiolipin synthase-like enzyme